MKKGERTAVLVCSTPSVCSNKNKKQASLLGKRCLLLLYFTLLDFSDRESKFRYPSAFEKGYQEVWPTRHSDHLTFGLSLSVFLRQRFGAKTLPDNSLCPSWATKSLENVAWELLAFLLGNEITRKCCSGTPYIPLGQQNCSKTLPEIFFDHDGSIICGKCSRHMYFCHWQEQYCPFTLLWPFRSVECE